MSTKGKQHCTAPEVTGTNVGRPVLRYTVEDAVKLVSSLFWTIAPKFVMVDQEIYVGRHEFLL
jgi:hypothetical protein